MLRQPLEGWQQNKPCQFNGCDTVRWNGNETWLRQAGYCFFSAVVASSATEHDISCRSR
jgi:hypothetical protein